MRTSIKIAIATIVAVGAYIATHNETPKEKEARYIARGNDYFTKNEFQKARIEYRNAAKIMPTDPEIGYRWGLVDEAEGNIRNAYANFLQSEQQDPHYIPALLKIAHYQLVIEQYSEVQKRIDIVLEKDKDNAEGHAMKAALHLRRKELDATKSEIDLAFKSNPANITATSVLAGLYLAQGDITKAESAVDEGIAKNPKDISLLLLKVRMFEQPLNLEKVNKTYQEIIKLQPNDKQLRGILADIYMQAGKTEEAETTLRSAVHDLSDDWALKHQLVNFLAKHKNMDAAEKEIQSYMQAYPDRGELYFWLAELYLNHDQIDKAIALLEQIVAKDSSDRQSLMARSSLARINFRKGNKELAEKLVTAVLAKAPNNAEALYVRASISTDTGRYQSAVSDLRTIIRDNPKNRDAHQLLGEVLLLQGYIDLAIETLSQLVELEPTNAPAQVRLAQMYNENKDPQHAMKILEMLSKTNPDYPVTWEAMARVAIGTKDFETAHRAITHLQGFKGQDQVAKFLLGQLAQADGKQTNAIQSYYDIIKSDPNSTLAERALFELVEKHKSPDELMATAQFITSLNTDNAYINTILGEIYMGLKKTDLAAAAFDKAINNKSSLQDAYLNRAKLYHDAQQTDKVVELLNTAREANKNDIRADLFLASMEIDRKDYPAAINRFEDIMQRFPDLDLPINNYVSLVADHQYSDTEKLENAAKMAERFASGKNMNFLDTLAWVNFRLGRLEKAESMMLRCISLGELTPSMHYHYGAILEQLGNKTKAKSELEKATVPTAPEDVSKNATELLKKL